MILNLNKSANYREILWLLVASLLIVMGKSHRAEAQTKKPPTILLITADNLGYGDSRSPIKTPHLDV